MDQGPDLLRLLGVEPSAESVDYVRNKIQFQLHTLLTEQRHPRTWALGERIQENTLAGLEMLSSVDDDIRAKLEAMAADTGVMAALEQAAAAVEEAIAGGGRIYVYGCGATGRLAKQMESAFWRPFWRRAGGDDRIRGRIAKSVGEAIGDRLIGEMTGADRALISSLEGFEDLQLIGRLQLQDRGIKKGDVVICVTEGGETSSVIGTILAAHGQWKGEPGYRPEDSRKRLYFVYNNPDDRLMPFERSRKVLEEPGITRVNLTTGPQAITGSTRMQATTIETYVVGAVIEAGVAGALGRFLTAGEMRRLGFETDGRAGRSGRLRIAARLREFGSVLEGVRHALPALARLTDLEAATYSAGRFSTYFAEKGLITVFIDSTERSPTFRLYPLDTVGEPRRRCWIQVWTGARTPSEAWGAFLGRPFRGLTAVIYGGPFATEIDDPYLKRAALESLKRAGDSQQELYDFSFPGDRPGDEKRVPTPGDLGIMVALTPEEALLEPDREGGGMRGDEEQVGSEDPEGQGKQPGGGRPGRGGAETGRGWRKGSDGGSSYFRQFMDLCAGQGAALGLLFITDKGEREAEAIAERARRSFESAKDTPVVVTVRVAAADDPFGLRQQVAAKMALNAHSTAVMAKLGKVVGNTMTNVSPSNLKLIGRATYLIQSHVNDVLARPGWAVAHGRKDPITYAEANAVLFDAIAYLRDKQNEAGQTAEVAFSIIRILESLKQGHGLARDEALNIIRTTGLRAYLASF